MSETRYEAIQGFNTKQWWVFDSKKNKLIDPPLEVLNSLKKTYRSDTSEGIDAQRNELERIANATPNPKWLKDKNYIYSGNMEI